MLYLGASNFEKYYLAILLKHFWYVWSLFLQVMDLGANTTYKYSCSTLSFTSNINKTFAVYIFNVNVIDHPLIYTKTNYVYVSHKLMDLGANTRFKYSCSTLLSYITYLKTFTAYVYKHQYATYDYQYFWQILYVSPKFMDLGARSSYKPFLSRYSTTLLICYLGQWNQGNFQIHQQITINRKFDYVSSKLCV